MAVVRTLARSEPDSGSVSSCQVRISPRRIHGEEVALLLLRAPDEDGDSAELAAGVVVGRQRHVVAIELLLQRHGEFHGEPAAAVLGGHGGVEPALRAEPAPELALEFVLLAGEVRRVGVVGNVGDVRLDPGARLLPEGVLFRRPFEFEVHNGRMLARRRAWERVE